MEHIQPKRRSLRLRGFDYAQAGAYFVTICSHNKQCFFGNIVDFRMQLNNIGTLVVACWKELANQYKFVKLDEWILMPNHLHGIIWLDNNQYGKSLGRIVATFKAMSTAQVRKTINPKINLWQRNFFEHVIRNEEDLFRIREYIIDNPVQWAVDLENPDLVRINIVRAHAMRPYSTSV